MPVLDEYWINVYRGGRLGTRRHRSVEKCIVYGWSDEPIDRIPVPSYMLPIYRLHVRLKRKIYNHQSR